MRVRFGHVFKKVSLFSGMAVLLLSVFFSFLSQPARAEQGNFTRHITTAGSAPQFIATGPDGALWTTLLDNRIAHVTTDHVLTYITVTDMSNGTVQLSGITAGPDGNMWASEQSGNNIDRITMDGVVTRFPMSDGGLGAPSGIVTGPDGNLWFSATNGVGMITTDGVVTSYPFPNPGDDHSGYDIAVGHDGNLWVVEQNGNSIARVTTDGVITEFNVPTPDSRPTSITRGFDGNMWFTSLDSGRVGKITPDGVITEYTLPSQLSTPFGITRGYGQDLWIIDPNSGAVGKITPDGTVTVQPTQSPLYGSHLTTGPDGNLWFAELDLNLGDATGSVTQMIIDDIPPVLGPLPSTIRDDATSLSGTINEPGSTLVLTLGNGSTINTTSDQDGNFTFNFPAGSLHAGDSLSISATDLSNNTINVPIRITVVSSSAASSAAAAASSNGTLANTGSPLASIVAMSMATVFVSAIWLVRRYAGHRLQRSGR